MYPYSRSVSPAAKSHLEAQLSFFNGISKSLFRSVQQFSELNLQFAQGLLEESRIAGQHLITVDRAEDLFQAAAASGQPVAEQLRIYQQQASRLAADAQVDLASVAEKHVAETSRTAKVLAEEVARTASEETEKNVRKQQDAIQRISEPFQAFQNGSSRDQRGAQAQTQSRAGESLQSATHQGSQQSGSAESGAAHTAGSAGQGKTSSSTGRKE